jgi:CRISPR-associated protein Cmr2
MNKEELWLYKTAALLHDPPDKAWVITGRISVTTQLGDRLVHESRAWLLANKILERTPLLKASQDHTKYFFSKKVGVSDEFVAGIDRTLLSDVLPEEERHKLVRSLKIKNIFDPYKEKTLEEKIDEEEINKFVTQLNSILNGINDIKLEYFALYALYELAWIKSNLPVSPADTRVPTHSVFDHNYATTSAINLFIQSDNEPNGLVVMIDIPSVQEYISASRKLRDLRISSYLISLIAWKTVEAFVDLYGPDVLILPTTRFNPFFYMYLMGKVYDKTQNDGLIDKIYEFLKLKYDEKEIKILEKGRFPSFGVIPPTITFLLPPFEYMEKDKEFKEIMNKYNITILNKETLKMLIYKFFENQWENIYNEIKNNYKQIKDIKIKSVIENIVNVLEKVKSYYNFENPPFDLRTIIIDIKEDIINKRKEELLKNDGRLDYRKVYEIIFEELYLELSKLKHLKVDSFSKINLTSLTNQIYQGNRVLVNEYNEDKLKRGYEYCTVCGKLPAVLTVPTGEKEYYDFLSKIAGGASTRLEPYFTEGEKFCPYCLIKRIITFEEIFESILNEFFGIRDELKDKFKADVHVPSLADISTYEFKKKLILNNLNKESDIDKIVKTAEEITKKEVRKPGKLFTSSSWIFYNKLFNEIKKSKLSDNQKVDLEYFFLYKESEDLFLKDVETKRKWISLAKDIGIGGEPWIYYALIKSDADNMGKIISGDVFLPLHLDLKNEEENLERYRDCYFKEYLKKVYNLELSEEELEKRISNVINNIKIKTVISFSYHSSISKSLMLNALIDNLFIEELDGFTIYTGGDDLLALSPVSKSLEIVSRTAKSFNKGNSDGFYCIGRNYYVPNIKTGRSYVMCIAHYMYPMYAVIKSSNAYLEDMSKESKWKIRDEEYNDNCLKVKKIFKKNSLAVVYLPRGSESYAVLPLYGLSEIGSIKASSNSNCENILDIMNEIINDLYRKSFEGERVEEVYSTRLVYDLTNEENIIRWKILNEKNKDLLRNDIIKNVVERHLNARLSKEEKENEKRKFEDYIDLTEGIFLIDEKYSELLLIQLFKAIRVLQGGFRGV